MLLMAVFIIPLGELEAQSKSLTGEKGKDHIAAKARRHTHKLEKELSLTPEQVSKITEINTTTARKMKALRAQENNMNQKEIMKQIKALKEERNNQYKTILTPEQYKKWSDLQLKKRYIRHPNR